MTPEAPEAVTATADSTTGQEPTPEGEKPEGGKDIEGLEAALREARNDAIKYRTRLRALEAAEQERADAELSEAERAAKRAAELEAQLAERDAQAQQLALESAVALKANSLGIVDAEAALALVDRAELDFDDAGRPTSASLDAALRHLLKTKPYLKTQPAPASPANPARTTPASETDEQRRARIYGGNAGIFDTGSAADHGGGVISRTKE